MQHCIERKKNPFGPSPNELIIFLTRLFNEGKGYSSLNLARSAVATLSLNTNCSVGNHILVRKFLRGVFNRRPALPRTDITWDADIVLNFLKSWSPASTLSLLQLTVKVVLLCLLVSGQRGQTVWQMDLRNMTWTKNEVRCRFGDPLKTSTPRTHQCEVTFGAFPSNKALCVVRYMQQYVKRTQTLRGKETKFFISVKAPHKAVGRDTIRRWTKLGLQKAGIDMSVFTPHSTRAASTSKAVRKVPLKTILQTVGWRRPSTFAVFYHKKVVSGKEFGNAVLQ